MQSLNDGGIEFSNYLQELQSHFSKTYQSGCDAQKTFRQKNFQSLVRRDYLVIGDQIGLIAFPIVLQMTGSAALTGLALLCRVFRELLMLGGALVDRTSPDL